jgi:hypothetical protein
MRLYLGLVVARTVRGLVVLVVVAGVAAAVVLRKDGEAIGQ